MKNITIFTSSTCPYCISAKDYFKHKNIPFEEKNVSTDPSARKELMAKGYMGVPVIIIDGEELIGFDEERLNKILD
ncbi:MAG: glutaredoxin family protein [Tissierellales bacterium]|jgi:glutaredoxin-like YruB-family protein|nr:glutaredoxin family protein [Tissierellales bacterium]